MDKSVKLNAVESIRGLACLAVVFSHLSLSFYPYLHHFDEHEIASNASLFETSWHFAMSNKCEST